MPPTRADPLDLTDRQQTILDFVQEFQGIHGYPPSMREIGEHFGIRSTNGVSDHLRALERKGFLQRSGNLSRSLTIVKPTREVEAPPRPLAEPALEKRLPPNVRPLRRPADHGGALIRRDQLDSHARRDQSALVPVLGRVAAGLPLLAVEDAEETLVVDQYLLGGPGEVFALRVVGESMIEAGILPGDYLFVRKRDTARAGEIVVAMIAGEATVKRYFPEGDTIRLQPENSTMQPIYVRRGAADEFQLVGAVVGVYRKL